MDNQVKNASGVVNQGGGSMSRGTRLDPPTGDGKFGMGPGLSNTQTRNSSSVVDQTSGSSGSGADDRARGARRDPPEGAQLPGAGMKGTQTRNSNPTRA